MDPIFEGILEAAKGVGLEAKRVKDVVGDYQITLSLSVITGQADLADLVTKGLARTSYAGDGKTVVTCARKGQRFTLMQRLDVHPV
jgi:hypothetical protein